METGQHPGTKKNLVSGSSVGRNAMLVRVARGHGLQQQKTISGLTPVSQEQESLATMYAVCTCSAKLDSVSRFWRPAYSTKLLPNLGHHF